MQADDAADGREMARLGLGAGELALVNVDQPDDAVGGLDGTANRAAPFVRVHGHGLHLPRKEGALWHGYEKERLRQHVIGDGRRA